MPNYFFTNSAKNTNSLPSYDEFYQILAAQNLQFVDNLNATWPQLDTNYLDHQFFNFQCIENPNVNIFN
ncbi:hypothetical protein HZS_4248 [Henneguya salminicola]|nr:hypothetical protein HZS_4248 [Henneguya salminicola]